MHTKQTSANVNSGRPELTLCHRFQNGQTGTFKLWRKPGRTALEWAPELPPGAMPPCWHEYYRWYGFVLGHVVEHLRSTRRVIESTVLHTDRGVVTGWNLELANGFRLKVETAATCAYIVSVTKHGCAAPIDLGLLEWIVEMVQAFVLRTKIL